MKTCNGPCGLALEESEFGKRTYKDGHVGLRSFCKKCNNLARDAWRQANRLKDNNRNKEYNKLNAKKIKGHKLTKYWPNTTPEEANQKYQELLDSQNDLCAICGNKEERKHDETGTMWGLAVDHDHGTGVVRGALCNSCNRGLGLLGDSVEGIKKALTYLEKGKPMKRKEEWKKEWKQMPEFEQEDLTPYRKIVVAFRNDEDVEIFKILMEQEITPKQKAIWYPYAEPRKRAHLRYEEDDT